MGEEMKCLLFRNGGSSRMGRRIGSCDIDAESATCEGDVTFCEKPDALRQYFRERLQGFRKEEKREDKEDKED